MAAAKPVADSTVFEPPPAMMPRKRREPNNNQSLAVDGSEDAGLRDLLGSCRVGRRPGASPRRSPSPRSRGPRSVRVLIGREVDRVAESRHRGPDGSHRETNANGRGSSGGAMAPPEALLPSTTKKFAGDLDPIVQDRRHQCPVIAQHRTLPGGEGIRFAQPKPNRSDSEPTRALGSLTPGSSVTNPGIPGMPTLRRRGWSPSPR
jgi:hypothetical protein